MDKLKIIENNTAAGNKGFASGGQKCKIQLLCI